MSNNATDDFLFGGGGKSAKFENIGDDIEGTIVTSEVRQQTDLATGNPMVWDNGDPRMQLVVTLQTTLKDDADDDGMRAVYVKGSKKAGSKSLHDAVAQAVKASGSKGLEPGGTLLVTYSGTEPSQTRGFNDRKLYTATYSAPDRAAETGGFLGTNEQVNTTTGEITTPPAAQPAAQAPAGDQPTPEQIAAVKAAGLDPTVVFPNYAA